MLSHAFVKWLFGLFNVEVWAFLATLYSIHYVVKFLFRSCLWDEPVFVWLGLKYTGMLCSEKTLLSFSDKDAT